MSILSVLFFIPFYLVNNARALQTRYLNRSAVYAGGAVVGIVGGSVTFRFLNGEAILDENMLFWVRLYALVVVLKILLDIRL